MELIVENGKRVLTAAQYVLTFQTDRPFVYLDTPEGNRIAELFIFSSVHPINGRDDTYQTGEWVVEEHAEYITFSVSAKSTTWRSKTYRFRCWPQRFTYQIGIEGEGSLADVYYFGGHYSESLRWGSGFFWSGQSFSQVFNPEPNIPETYHHNPGGGTKIDLMGVPIPAKGDWFFTPPPFCFAGQYGNKWLALGIQTEPGGNQFTEYHYHGSLGAFYLSLAYEGHTHINGFQYLPEIGFDFAADEYSALESHVQALRDGGHNSPPILGETPSWWRSPIFCGWGAQCYLASLEKGHAPTYARQEHYMNFLESLEKHNLEPGIIVLDDKWQAAYGENIVDTTKWPNLRGFIDQQHARKRHVLLWLKAWDPEGLPTEECITHSGGSPIAFDPTNPAFEKRLRAAVRRMLSPDGYDADGFKIDFTARIPSGYGIHIHKDLWGLELMRHYLWILHSEAKAVKPDALIMSHTPHPYLADVVDMIRLNDINIGQDVNRAMLHRAKVASIACPEAIIDTDNWPITDKAAWERYMKIQPDIGVPSLYYTTHIDFTQEVLTEADYNLIREVWEQARAKPREQHV